MVGLVGPFGDSVDLPVLRLGLQPDLSLLSCSVVLATKSRPSSGARISFMAASLFFTWQACGALSPSHESRRKAGTLCKRLVWASTRPLAHSRSQACSGPPQVSSQWHLPAKQGVAPSPLLTQCLLKPQQRLRLSCGADVGVSLLTSLTALQAAGKSNHWQM